MIAFDSFLRNVSNDHITNQYGEQCMIWLKDVDKAPSFAR